MQAEQTTMAADATSEVASAADSVSRVSRKDPYLYYRKSLLSPERVRALSRLRPARVCADAAGCWLCIFAAWALVAWQPCWWTVCLAVPIVGSRYYALFIIGHDGLHRRLFRGAWRNDLFNDLVIFSPIGAITRINNQNHLNHHHYLTTARDPDRHKHGCFNKVHAGQLLGFLTGLTSVARSVRNVFFGSAATPASPQAQATRPAYTLRDAVLLLGWQVFLIGGLTVAIGWWAYPVLWLAPVYLFAFLADNFRSFAEHSHPEADARADEHRLITYDSSPLERLFVAPMNMNYHTVHHLWTSIPYYNLPVADREIRQRPEAQTLEWRGSYLAYLWRYWRALPLVECQPPPAQPLPPA